MVPPAPGKLQSPQCLAGQSMASPKAVSPEHLLGPKRGHGIARATAMGRRKTTVPRSVSSSAPPMFSGSGGRSRCPTPPSAEPALETGPAPRCRVQMANSGRPESNIVPHFSDPNPCCLPAGFGAVPGRLQLACTGAQGSPRNACAVPRPAWCHGLTHGLCVPRCRCCCLTLRGAPAQHSSSGRATGR